MAAANKEAGVAAKTNGMVAAEVVVAGDKVVTKVEVGAVEEVKALGVVTKPDKVAKAAGAAAMVVTKAAMEAATAKLQAVEQPEAWEVVMAVAKVAMVVVVQCDPPEAWEVVAV